jgi:hypothetical protein
VTAKETMLPGVISGEAFDDERGVRGAVFGFAVDLQADCRRL